MTLLDNIIANGSNVGFTTVLELDKVAMYSVTNDASEPLLPNTRATLGAASGLPFASVAVASITNPYGRKCLPTLSWSPDGTNYYPMNVPVFYYNATYMQYMWQALSFAGCSDSLIYIGFTTQYNASQTLYIQYAFDSPT